MNIVTAVDGGARADTQVALVAVTLGSDPDTRRLIDTAIKSGYDYAVVVDCGGDTEIRDELVGLMGVSVLRPGENIGYGPGCNLGVRHAIQNGATVLVLANPDLHCDSATLRALAHRCRAGELVAPVLNRPDGRVFKGGVIAASSGATAAGTAAQAAWVSTAVVAISADDWLAVEGFDPRFFIYWDDVDLCTRLIKSGRRITVDESLVVTHVGRGSHRGRRGDLFYAFLNGRNRLLYAQKHAGTKYALLQWVVGSLRYVLLVSDMGRHGRIGRLVACSAGTVAGLVNLAGLDRWGRPPRYLLRPKGALS